ncbi:MAG: bacitracin ABC transporter ATP-binding protein [Bacteroidetes bacterium RIFCSPLOWO2_12_FULL_35_15]|nr:MAG: bacitracin ABC transporter ATP-binding protein [Bacteroidetes bacterium RIFCSPLOWO2_12_FULL_35_15]
MSDTPEKIIEIKHLVKHFGKFKAVEDVNFDVFRGDIFGFLGPNGAGKSTTIRAMLSLIRPTSGELKLFGKDLLKNRSYILQRIGCIVEKPDFYKYLSAEKNIEIFARLSGVDVSKSKVHKIIEFVGLKGRERDKVNGFSHGMKQRLGIAQTLVHDPELIILDEPTTGLDPQGIIDIRNLILQLKNEHNKTVLLSSHILSEIELIATRLVIINKGKTIVQGSVSDLLNAQELVVSFTIDNIEKAKQIVQSSSLNITLESETSTNLLLHISQEKIPLLNKLFCDNGINVFSIEAKRKLEDYFLKLISA